MYLPFTIFITNILTISISSKSSNVYYPSNENNEYINPQNTIHISTNNSTQTQYITQNDYLSEAQESKFYNLSAGIPSADIIPHTLMSESIQAYFNSMEHDAGKIYQLNYELNTGGNISFKTSVIKLYKQYLSIEVDMRNIITSNAITGATATLAGFILKNRQISINDPDKNKIRNETNPHQYEDGNNSEGNNSESNSNHHSYSSPFEVKPDHNNTIYVQNPGNPIINSILEDLGLDLKPLNLDKHFNPNVEEFKQTINTLKENNQPLPFAVYFIPFHSCPSGVTFSEEAILDLVQFCIENEIYVLSDETYIFLAFEKYSSSEVHMPVYHYFPQSDFVFSMNSFSYMIVPGVRTGWIYASKSNIMNLNKFSIFSFGVANINEGMISHMIDTGRLQMGLKRIKRTLTKRRDAYYLRLASMMLNGKVRFITQSKGGYFFLMGVNADTIKLKECMKESNYSIDIKDRFEIENTQWENYITISYSFNDFSIIFNGLNVLEECIYKE